MKRFKKRLMVLAAVLVLAGLAAGGEKDSAQTGSPTSEAQVESGTNSAQAGDSAAQAAGTSATQAARPEPAPAEDTAQVPEMTEESAEESPAEDAQIPAAQTGFEVHFIDVGQADSALVLCDGEAMLIDGGNVEDSSLIYTYLKDHGVDHLSYIVCTHPHEDHVGGLAGALNYAAADKAFCSVDSYDSEAFANFTKYLAMQDLAVNIPSAGDRFTLGSAQAEILGPLRTDETDLNNMSIVLRVVYGGTSFLFTGDAGREEEQDILAAGYSLESTVLKVGHHGGSSGTTYPFLREVMPEYAVISVGADNPYGHPTEEVLSRLRDAGAEVLRTDMLGDIVCVSDGSRVTFSTEKDPDQAAPGETYEETEENVPAPEGINYVLNTNTHKFHYPYCSSVGQMKDSNKYFYTGTRSDVIAMGYEPCGRCNP